MHPICLNDRVLVKRDAPPTQIGNIYLPEQIYTDLNSTGAVIAVGPGAWERTHCRECLQPYRETAKREVPEFGIGDRVVFQRYHDTIALDGDEHYSLWVKQIIAIVDGHGSLKPVRHYIELDPVVSDRFGGEYNGLRPGIKTPGGIWLASETDSSQKYFEMPVLKAHPESEIRDGEWAVLIHRPTVITVMVDGFQHLLIEERHVVGIREE